MYEVGFERFFIYSIGIGIGKAWDFTYRERSIKIDVTQTQL